MEKTDKNELKYIFSIILIFIWIVGSFALFLIQDLITVIIGSVIALLIIIAWMIWD